MSEEEEYDEKYLTYEEALDLKPIRREDEEDENYEYYESFQLRYKRWAALMDRIEERDEAKFQQQFETEDERPQHPHFTNKEDFRAWRNEQHKEYEKRALLRKRER